MQKKITTEIFELEFILLSAPALYNSFRTEVRFLSKSIYNKLEKISHTNGNHLLCNFDRSTWHWGSTCYILKTPNLVFSIGLLRAAESDKPRIFLVSAGSITPSSQIRAVEKYGEPSSSNLKTWSRVNF